MNRIARVFPRKTAASPTDALAFFREPTADDFASCIEADISAVHISVTFTWDIPRVEDLYYAWQILGVPVMVGGPAFDDVRNELLGAVLCDLVFGFIADAPAALDVLQGFCLRVRRR